MQEGDAGGGDTSSPWDEPSSGNDSISPTSPTSPTAPTSSPTSPTAAATLPPAAAGPLVLGSTDGLSIESQSPLVQVISTNSAIPALTGQVTQLSGGIGTGIGIAVPELDSGSWLKGLGICFGLFLVATIPYGAQISYQGSWDDNWKDVEVSNDAFVGSTFNYNVGEPIDICSFTLEEEYQLSRGLITKENVQGEVDSLYVSDDCDGGLYVNAQIVAGSFDVDSERITITLPKVYVNATEVDVQITYLQSGKWRSTTTWVRDVWLADGVNKTFSFQTNSSAMNIDSLEVVVLVANDNHRYRYGEWYSDDEDGNKPMILDFEQDRIGTIDYLTGEITFTLPFEIDNQADYRISYEQGSAFGEERGEIFEEVFYGFFLTCCMPLLLIGGWIGMLVRSFATQQQKTAFGMLVGVIPGFIFFVIAMMVISFMVWNN